ncbi:hypothetical protein GPALN_014140 [Globodera pallida]|nr:hypothetical protein GPALN_014140 [Globodera pallida]
MAGGMGISEEKVPVSIGNLRRLCFLDLNVGSRFPTATAGCQSVAILSLRHNRLRVLSTGRLNVQNVYREAVVDLADNSLRSLPFAPRRSVAQPEVIIAWKRNAGLIMLCLFFICGGRTSGGSSSNNQGGRSGGCGKKQQKQQQQSSRGGGGGKRPNSDPQKKAGGGGGGGRRRKAGAASSDEEEERFKISSIAEYF